MERGLLGRGGKEVVCLLNRSHCDCRLQAVAVVLVVVGLHFVLPLLVLVLTAALPPCALHFNYLQFSANVSRTIALLIGIL